MSIYLFLDHCLVNTHNKGTNSSLYSTLPLTVNITTLRGSRGRYVAVRRLRIVDRIGGAPVAATVLGIRITGFASLHVSLCVFCQVV